LVSSGEYFLDSGKFKGTAALGIYDFYFVAPNHYFFGMPAPLNLLELL